MTLSFLRRFRARATASRRERADSFDSFVRYRTHVLPKLTDIVELRVGFAYDDSQLVVEMNWTKCETTSSFNKYRIEASKCRQPRRSSIEDLFEGKERQRNMQAYRFGSHSELLTS